MNRLLLDTSALSDVMSPVAARSPVVETRMRDYLRSQGRFTFSRISFFEIWRGLLKKNSPRQLEQFREFCRHSELLEVTLEVLECAADVWAEGARRGVKVEDADLIVAATALVESLGVVTANPKHFSWIDGLTVSNWRIN